MLEPATTAECDLDGGVVKPHSTWKMYLETLDFHMGKFFSSNLIRNRSAEERDDFPPADTQLLHLGTLTTGRQSSLSSIGVSPYSSHAELLVN